MKKYIVEANRTCNEAMHYLFEASYYVGKEIISFHKSSSLCSLFGNVKANMIEKFYHYEKNCGKILFYISSVVQKKVLNRVRDSRFFGIMINESTYIYVTGHLVLFASFVE